MNVSRRDFAVAGVALGASALLLSDYAGAQAADEAALAQSIETLREGILRQDKAKLDQVAASQISYGHSDGRVQNKAEFIDGVMTRKQVQKSLTFPELKVFVITGGVMDLIPLTGMAMPFLAQGGSSVVTNWAIVALLIRVSDSARRQYDGTEAP